MTWGKCWSIAAHNDYASISIWMSINFCINCKTYPCIFHWHLLLSKLHDPNFQMEFGSRGEIGLHKLKSSEQVKVVLSEMRHIKWYHVSVIVGGLNPNASKALCFTLSIRTDESNLDRNRLLDTMYLSWSESQTKKYQMESRYNFVFNFNVWLIDQVSTCKLQYHIIQTIMSMKLDQVATSCDIYNADPNGWVFVYPEHYYERTISCTNIFALIILNPNFSQSASDLSWRDILVDIRLLDLSFMYLRLHTARTDDPLRQHTYTQFNQYHWWMSMHFLCRLAKGRSYYVIKRNSVQIPQHVGKSLTWMSRYCAAIANGTVSKWWMTWSEPFETCSSQIWRSIPRVTTQSVH